MKALRPLSVACAMALATGMVPAGYGFSQDALAACAAIAAPEARLACYDRLAHAAAAKAPAPASAPTATSSPSPAPATAAAPAAASAGAALPKESFGLYSAEHPTPPPATDTLQARVQSFGRNANGRPTVALAGEGLWELDDSDPLLAVGDTVTIKRASLGSFILTTPGKRTHRVRRLN